MVGVTETRAWPGLIERYRERLPVGPGTPVVTLLEGGTPLVPAPVLSARTGCDVWLKVEGANPTGSFKDRGMTVAVSRALEEGARAVLCASTGNTSASAAAARAAIPCAVVIPEGRIALGKLAQALVHGASVLAVDGSFDDCLVLVRELAERYPVALVNSSTRCASRARRRSPSRSSRPSAPPPTSTASRSATPATSPPPGWATPRRPSGGR